MPKALAISALSLAALIGTHAHSHEAHDHNAAPIIASIKPVHSLVSSIMGETGVAQLLVQGKASPHGYQLKPSQVRDLQSAALVFYIAPDLEDFLPSTLASLPADVRAVSLIDNEQLQLWPYRLDGAWAAGHEGHDHGHGHDDHDEHGHEEHDEHGHDEHAHEEHDDMSMTSMATKSTTNMGTMNTPTTSTTSMSMTSMATKSMTNMVTMNTLTKSTTSMSMTSMATKSTTNMGTMNTPTTSMDTTTTLTTADNATRTSG